MDGIFTAQALVKRIRISEHLRLEQAIKAERWRGSRRRRGLRGPKAGRRAGAHYLYLLGPRYFLCKAQGRDQFPRKLRQWLGSRRRCGVGDRLGTYVESRRGVEHRGENDRQEGKSCRVD